MARKKLRYMPMIGDSVLAPDWRKKGSKDPELPAIVIDASRPSGVTGATVRYKDKELQSLPDGGMRWHPARNLELVRRRGGLIGLPTGATPSRGAVLQAKSADLQGEDLSLQTEAKPATISRGAKRRRKSTQSTTRRTSKMATATRGRKRASSTKDEETTTTTKRSRGKATKAKEEAAPAKKNGNDRRTHEDILDLVPEIVEHLRNGVTMTEIRLGGDIVGDGYGNGPTIRRALAEKGYNTKGEKVEVEDLSDLKGVKLAKAVAELREQGKAWYYLELATDMAQADLQELLVENGYEHLAEGRVSVATEDEEEPEEKPAPKKSRKRGSTAKAEPEAEEKPATKRSRRRGKANPSEES